MSKKILVVDDKKELRELLKSYLTPEGFNVVEASDGQEALYVARHEKPDLIILDLMMPEMGGYEFMRPYSREADTPIIILTAKLEESDKVLGLELGADDYVTKPFSMRELTARVRAVLRRAAKSRPRTRYPACGRDHPRPQRPIGDGQRRAHRSDPLRVRNLGDPDGRTGAGFHAPSSCSIACRAAAFEGYERTIDVHIRNLRIKIEPDDSNPRYIETVYGIGYRFAPQR